MRINLEIDDALINKAIHLSGLNSISDIVEEALMAYIQMNNQEKIRDLRGKIRWEGDLGAMRTDNKI